MWSTSYVVPGGTTVSHPDFRIGGIFTIGELYWLTKVRYTGHGFTIKLSTCKTSIVGVRVKNVAHSNARATHRFHVSGVLNDSGPWEQLLEGEFENPLLDGAPAPTVQTFYFKEAVELQFLRFDIESLWETLGGGLDYFAVITVAGNPCGIFYILMYLYVPNRFVPIE